MSKVNVFYRDYAAARFAARQGPRPASALWDMLEDDFEGSGGYDPHGAAVTEYESLWFAAQTTNYDRFIVLPCHGATEGHTATPIAVYVKELMASVQHALDVYLGEVAEPRERILLHGHRHGALLDWREAATGVWKPLRSVAVEPEPEPAPDPVEVAAAAFARALRAQRGVAALGVEEAAALGERAADLVGSGLEWYEHVGEVVDVHQAQAVLRVGSRQAVYDLVKRHRLLGLRRSGGAMAIPMFQIDPATGRPYRAVPPVLAEFAAADVDPYTVASWFNTPQIELDGDTPASAIRLPAREDAVRACAKAAAERWAG